MEKILLFDWGNTVMVDFVLPGPMCNWDKVDLVPGADLAMDQLVPTYSCYLATNAGASTTEEVLRALRRVDAEKYFTGIFLAEEVGFKKPDIRFFQAIIGKLGKPADTFVMIGDNYFNDCAGAKDAGMKTVLFNDKRIRGHFPKADKVIHSMDELPEAIDNL